MDDTLEVQGNHGFSTNGTRETLTIEERVAGYSPAHRRGVLDMILGLSVSDWFSPGCMAFLATFRNDKILWPRIVAIAREHFQPRAALEAAILILA